MTKTNNKVQTKGKKETVKKAVNIAANVLIVIICLFVLVFAIMAITNRQHGYNKIFGSTVLAVESDSMTGKNKDSFNKGDLIVAKLLSDKDKKELKEGDIITFWFNKDGKKQLNTHRIVSVKRVNDKGEPEPIVKYYTKGDAAAGIDINSQTDNPVEHEIVAKYSFKMNGVGNALLFMQSKNGFLVFVVIPSVIAVAYCAYLFVVNLKGYKKVSKEDEKKELREQLKNELLKEIGKENEPSSDKDDIDVKKE